jgi:hypothetical protein
MDDQGRKTIVSLKWAGNFCPRQPQGSGRFLQRFWQRSWDDRLLYCKQRDLNAHSKVRASATGKENAMFFLSKDLVKLHLAFEFLKFQARSENWPQETERGFFLRKVRSGRPRLQERFFLRVGDLLISFGFWLKARYQLEPAAPVLSNGRV